MDLTTLETDRTPGGVVRLQAFFSSLMVTMGAFLAAFAVLALLVVTLPLMLAATATMQLRGQAGRPGWHELEPVEA